jgi:Rieske Fe-S protein
MSDRAHPPTSDQNVDASTAHDPHGPTRRTVLRAAGLAALAGGGAAALAACSSDAGTAAPAASSAAAPSGGASSSAPAASSSASAPAGPASVAAADVPVGGGVVLKDANYVITQPKKGQYKAFSKICTHMGCPVAEVTKTIDCHCHGSKYSIEDGSVVNPPATKGLAESPVTVSGDKVVVST